MSSTAPSRVPDSAAPRAASGPKLAAWTSPAPASTAADHPSAQAPSADAQVVDEARREIQTLTREIADLATSNLAPAEFLAAMLARTVSALAADGGAVWLKGESGALD